MNAVGLSDEDLTVSKVSSIYDAVRRVSCATVVLYGVNFLDRSDGEGMIIKIPLRCIIPSISFCSMRSKQIYAV